MQLNIEGYYHDVVSTFAGDRADLLVESGICTLLWQTREGTVLPYQEISEDEARKLIGADLDG